MEQRSQTFQVAYIGPGRLTGGTFSPDAMRVIIDFHTHIFPPEVAVNREEYARRDTTFAEMYADPKARIASGEELLTSMDEAGVGVSVALGFAWQDHDACVRHNDYLLEVAAGSSGRILPFATVNLSDERALAEVERCAAAGARGIGELRPDNQGWEITGAASDSLAELAWKLDLVLLVHVTEPGDRSYAGRAGCELPAFQAFADKHAQQVMIVGAHLGGGIYVHPPKRDPDVYVDTAAQPFLYAGDEAKGALDAPPDDRLLFGSDWPLIDQRRQIEELRRVVTNVRERDAALGGNAARLLGIR